MPPSIPGTHGGHGISPVLCGAGRNNVPGVYGCEGKRFPVNNCWSPIFSAVFGFTYLHVFHASSCFVLGPIYGYFPYVLLPFFASVFFALRCMYVSYLAPHMDSGWNRCVTRVRLELCSLFPLSVGNAFGGTMLHVTAHY